MIKIRDVIAAEEVLEAAEAEFRRLNDDPSQWAAFESMDKQGRRTLNVHATHFERREAALAHVQAAHQQLLATKRDFISGVIDGGGFGAAI